MKKLVILSTALCCLAVPVLAQSTSASHSHSNSHANAQVYVNMPGNSGSGGGSNGGGGNDYTATIHNVPDMAVSSYAGAANACGVGGSVGVGAAGIGVGVSIAKEGNNCSKREWFKVLEITSEHRQAANDLIAAHAFNQWAVGVACSIDDIKAVAPDGYCGKPAPVTLASNRPEWCSTITPATIEANKAYVAKYCGQ